MDALLLLWCTVTFVLAIVMIAAQLKLFSIDKTLKVMLAELRGVRDAEHTLKMILYELRQHGRD